MPRIVACCGYDRCGSSLNPGWKEIGFGCGQTYYRYTGCGSLDVADLFQIHVDKDKESK